MMTAFSVPTTLCVVSGSNKQQRGRIVRQRTDSQQADLQNAIT